MQDDKKEFTLKQMTEILKRGWLTILVYVLVAAIVFGSVAAIVKTFATTNEYRAKIGFVSAVAPDRLITLSSSENVTKALTDIGMDEAEIPGYVDKIRAAISVSPIVYSNQTESDTQFVPSSYSVTMSEVEGLTEAKSLQVLNQIINNFIVAYNRENTSVPVNTENEQAFADYTSSDYIEIAYELNSKISAMKKIAESLASRSTTFVSTSTNISFADFISMLESLESQIESFDGYITIKGITKSVSGLSASEYITMRLNLAKSDQVKYEELSVKWKEVVNQVTASGSFTGTVDGQTIIIEDQTSYFTFLNNYLDAANKAADASAAYSYWESKKNVFDAATEFPNASTDQKNALLAEADKKVALLVSIATQMIEVYNDMVGDYNNSGLSSVSSANMITNAYVASTSALSNTVVLLIIALAVVLSALIGFVKVRKNYINSLAVADTAEENAPQQ